jgi:hypothetical protein
MSRKITFILTGAHAGKTIDLGHYRFKDGSVTVAVTEADCANQPLPESNEHVGGDRRVKNLAAGVANITRYMERAFNAYPAPAPKEGEVAQ